VLREEKGGGERGGGIERTVPGVGTEGEYAVKVEVAVRNTAGGAPILRANNAASPGAVEKGMG